MPSVLIVDDEPNIRRMVGALLSAEGYDVREAEDGASGLAAAAREESDVVLLDLLMPGSLDGMATLTRLREAHPDIPVVMMSGRAGLGDAVRATRLGAFNFLEKPLTPESVLLTAAAAAELRRTKLAARALREELGIGGQMIGSSPQIQAVRVLIERVAPTDSRVLITGESGTGKELVAAAIHDASRRRDRAFIRVNCAAIPRDLVESEMFGHERGAFTGATQTRIGRFELAHGGTLFLDEIGDLGAEAQAKLLRAIEAKEIQRVGGSKTVNVDVRIIAATNHDLARGVSEGVFREDLFFRLNVIPLAVPSLREREGDAIELAKYFTDLHHSRTGHPRVTWTSDALAAIAEYSWPGNVRELANIVERMGILYPGEELTRAHLLAVLPTAAAGKEDGALPSSEVALADALDDYERRLILRALALAKWNVADAARRLSTDRPNLYRRLKRLGIDDPRV
ncbi:MAG: sigma-54-dependent transcriptional regulator [Gemmatimonadaceae bacterium]